MSRPKRFVLDFGKWNLRDSYASFESELASIGGGGWVVLDAGAATVARDKRDVRVRGAFKNMRERSGGCRSGPSAGKKEEGVDGKRRDGCSERVKDWKEFSWLLDSRRSKLAKVLKMLNYFLECG